MRVSAVQLWTVLTASVTAQVTLTGTNSDSVTSTAADYATGSDLTYATAVVPSTLPTTGSYVTLTALSSSMSGTGLSNATTTRSHTSTSATETLLVGGTTSLNATTTGGNSTRTSTSAQPTNTQPCNGYPEFCQRRYSNITYVGAHNSPFIQPNNAAANQALDVITQLNDGIRMLQFQVHKPNETLLMCHTSCDLLNAGPLVTYLTNVTRWLDDNPYEVVTILMGNSDVLAPENFTAPIYDSGLRKYVYTPPTVPMPLASWPTLAEMIIRNTRAVVMLDYEANQDEIPWLLDEFSQMWETPFSPTDRDFPCTVQRPPDQAEDVSSDRMFMANHNLNVDISIASISLDVPAFTLLNETNGVTGYGSVGLASTNCTATWDRPPNFLLVDYYNIGSFNGSVFQVAANANNVTYNKNSCCGTDGTASSLAIKISNSPLALVAAAAVAIFMLV